MDSGGGGSVDSATMARLWIEGNVALFVVIVISAVLLLITVATVLLYCCCCRRKKASWSSSRGRLMSGGEASKSSGSHLQVDSGWRVDAVDADSAVTTTVREAGTVEASADMQLEQKQHHDDVEYSVELESSQHQLQSAEVVAAPEIVVSVSHDDEVEYSNRGLPPLPQGVMVTADAELRLRGRRDSDDYADADAELEGSRPMRLPRTEVVLRTESPSWEVQQQAQRQQPLKSAPQPEAAQQSASFTIAMRPHVMTASSAALRASDRPSHEHLHGSTIYQSDENEITIVDSDFSDYEDSPEDEARKRTARLSAGLSFDVGVGLNAQAGAAASDDFGWETLPNQTVAVGSIDGIDEPPVLAVDRHGEEYVPAPSPSLEEQQMRRADNLAQLDKTLDVFERQADDNDGHHHGGGGGGGFGVGIGVEIGGGGGGLGVEMQAGYVEEDEIQPTDRSQVPH